MRSSREIVSILIITLFVIAIISKLYLTSKNHTTPVKAEINSNSFHSVDSTQESPADTLYSGLFKTIPPPGKHDWLANHHEEGQTFEQFLSAPRNQLDSVRNKIYIVPIWSFMRSKSPSLELLRQYTELYFTIPVRLLPPVKPSTSLFSPIVNPHYGNAQVHAGMILSYLLKRVPEDAYCIIGVTMMDLYPDPDWNFVFGYAAYQKRVGVFSFCRFDPSFYDENDSTDHKMLLLRSCKILSHEIGHMFGIEHCIGYHCNMNGSNNLQESDAQPIHVCPVCLRKLQSVTGFDVLKRYQNLELFYEKNKFPIEAEWIRLMLEYLQK